MVLLHAILSMYTVIKKKLNDVIEEISHGVLLTNSFPQFLHWDAQCVPGNLRGVISPVTPGSVVPGTGLNI